MRISDFFGKERRQALRIGFEPGHILFGEVEQPRDIALLALGNVEDVEEGDFLLAGDDAIRLGHLGGERDHCNGKGDGAVLAPVPGRDDELHDAIDDMNAAGTDLGSDRADTDQMLTTARPYSLGCAASARRRPAGAVAP